MNMEGQCRFIPAMVKSGVGGGRGLSVLGGLNTLKDAVFSEPPQGTLSTTETN